MGLLTAQIVKIIEFPKSKTADGRHFHNRQIAISPQPFDQFWWNLARWRKFARYSRQTLKFYIFQKNKMAAVAILKNHNNRDITTTNWPILCKMGLLTAQTVKKFEIPKSKMAAILKKS